MGNVEGSNGTNNEVVHNSYEEISGAIDNLINDETGETLNQLNNTLTEDFLNNFVSSLTEQQKNNLISSVKKTYAEIKDKQSNYNDYVGLLNLAKSLGIILESTESDDIVKLGIVGELNSVDGSENKNPKYYFKSSKEEWSANLQEINDKIRDYKGRVTSLKENDKLSAYKEDLDKAGKLLEDVEKVINNPTESNVKQLQQFVCDNLEEADKVSFKVSNKFNSENGFDGKFGDATLAGLKKVGDKVTEFVDKLDAISKRENDSETGGKSNENSADKPGEKPKEDAPLVIDNVSYLVVENSRSISTECGFPNAIFYSLEGVASTVSKLPDGTYPKAPLETDGMREYYMQLTNNPDVYFKVKLDSSGNLCPIATMFDKKLKDGDGNILESRILISNNTSCMRYLHNRLPDVIKNSGISIGWDGKGNDYTLSSYERTLTIEPLSIAGDRVSDSQNEAAISKNLAFINLTNYIRYLGENFDKKDPDINTDLEVKGIKIDGKKIRINKDLFGLSDATPDEISRFKKYNNGEGWLDDRDNKKKNKFYRKVLIK